MNLAVAGRLRGRVVAALGLSLLLLGLLGLLGLLAGCAGGGSGPDAGGGSGSGGGSQAGNANTRFVSGSGTVTAMAPGDRRSAPDLRGTGLEGERLSLAKLRGRVVVVNVWGSWCAPCRREAPDLVAASKALAPKGVTFLGVNTRDIDRGPARAFVRTFQVPYPSIYDPHGEQLLGFRGTLPASAIPSTLVIDREGRVAARVLGALSARTLQDLTSDVMESR